MASDNLGNLYVTHNINDGSGSISKINSLDDVEELSNHPLLINPGGVDVDSEGNLYVVNFNDGNVIRIDSKGGHKKFAEIPGNHQWKSGHLKVIKDELYISGIQSNSIYNISAKGTLNVLANAEGKQSGRVKFLAGSIENPNGLVHDPETNSLYFSIAFKKNDRLQRVKL